MPPQLRQETRGPAAIVIDGAQQALSVARNLGRSGVPVYALTSSSEGVRFSRYARWLPMADGGSPKSWERFLTLVPKGEDHDRVVALVETARTKQATR